MTIGAPVATAGSTAARPTTPPATETVRWTGSWPTLVAWGAGLIQVALGAGALTGDDPSVWTAATGIALLMLGTAALVWGVLALASGRVIVPHALVTGSLVGVVAVVAAMMADTARVSVIAVAAASVLLVLLGAVGGVRLRHGRAADASRPGIIGMLVGALLVSALVTPALGATEAGRLAPDHSSHDIVFNEHGH